MRGKNCKRKRKNTGRLNYLKKDPRKRLLVIKTLRSIRSTKKQSLKQLVNDRVWVNHQLSFLCRSKSGLPGVQTIGGHLSMLAVILLSVPVFDGQTAELQVRLRQSVR